jgi:hypothetical protein
MTAIVASTYRDKRPARKRNGRLPAQHFASFRHAQIDAARSPALVTAPPRNNLPAGGIG